MGNSQKGHGQKKLMIWDLSLISLGDQSIEEKENLIMK